MLNCYPLGFYHPSTLVKDAERHGVVMPPIDVTRSDWKCTIEIAARRPSGERRMRSLRSASSTSRDCARKPERESSASARSVRSLRSPTSPRASRPTAANSTRSPTREPSRLSGWRRRDGAMAGGGGRARSARAFCRRRAGGGRRAAGRDGRGVGDPRRLRGHRTDYRASSDGAYAREVALKRHAHRRRSCGGGTRRVGENGRSRDRASASRHGQGIFLSHAGGRNRNIQCDSHSRSVSGQSHAAAQCGDPDGRGRVAEAGRSGRDPRAPFKELRLGAPLPLRTISADAFLYAPARHFRSDQHFRRQTKIPASPSNHWQ